LSNIRAHPALNTALSNTLGELLSSGSDPLAMQLIGYGIRPDTHALAASGYWSDAFPSYAAPTLDAVRVARVIGAAPNFVIDRLAQAVGSEDKDIAKEAVMALGANGAVLGRAPVLFDVLAIRRFRASR
jgi:hypothetical protein